MATAAMNSNRPMDPKLKKMMPFPIFGVHHVRNNPQPAYMKHFVGLDNMQICNVHCDHEDLFTPPSTPVVNPLKRLNLRSIPYKERAVPHFGMIPVSEPWRGELMNLTESVLFSMWSENQILPQMDLTDMRPLPVRRPMTSWIQKQPQNSDMRQSVQMSQVARPCTQMSQHGPRNPRTPLPNIDKSKSAPNSQESKLQDPQYTYANLDEADFEAQVFCLLCQILNVRNLNYVQQWLHCASNQDKSRVVEIIKGIFTTRAKDEENSLASIKEETDEDNRGETNVLTLEDRPDSQSTRTFHMAQKRPVTSLHSPYIYRPSSVANKRLTSSMPSVSSARPTAPQCKAQETQVEPVRLRLSTGVSRSSSFQASYSDNMNHRNVNLSADGYSQPAAGGESVPAPPAKYYGLKNIV